MSRFNEILHEEMFGYALGGKEPILNFIVRDVGKDFRKAISPLAPAFIKMVTKHADENGLPSAYIPYIWYLLYEKSMAWPTLTPLEKTALRLGGKLVAAESKMPNYARFKTAPRWAKETVDATIKGLAKDASKVLSQKGAQAYIKAIKQNAPRLKRAYPDKLASDSEATTTLMGFMSTSLTKYPKWFEDGHLQEIVAANQLTPTREQHLLRTCPGKSPFPAQENPETDRPDTARTPQPQKELHPLRWHGPAA
jgi:hypothetical protein